MHCTDNTFCQYVRKKKVIVSGIIVAIVVIVAVIAILYLNDGTHLLLTPSHLEIFELAAVSSDASPCAKIATDVLKRNGTAADAAVAGMFCVGVINAQSSGLGGGFLATYYSKKENKMYSLDAREVAPKLANRDMYDPKANHSADTRILLQEYFQQNNMEFNVTANTNSWWEKYKLARIKGGLSIAVPGETAGLHELHSKFGIIPWKELIEPTIKLCEEGYNLTWYTGEITTKSSNFLLAEPSMSIFINKAENRTFRKGERVYRKKLASTLRALQDNPLALYDGPLAWKLVEDIMSFGGIVLREDLKTYKPIWREPTKVHLKHGNFTLYSFPPPGSGLIVGLIMNILDEYRLNETNLSDKEIDRTQQIFAEAMKFTFANRYKLGDLTIEDAKKVMSELSADALALEIKNKINEVKTSQDPLTYGAQLTPFDDNGTAHLSIIAPNGDAISLTASINYGYGAGVRSEQTGIILNNEMGDFHIPEELVPGETAWMTNNLIEPGKRPLSSMSPTIILDSEGNVRLVVGAAGGARIPTAIAWTAARNLWMNQNIKEAIDAYRSHHQLQPMLLWYEEGFPKDLIENLEAKGHVMKQYPYKSVVQAIARISSGKLEANADYRKSGQIDGLNSIDIL